MPRIKKKLDPMGCNKFIPSEAQRNAMVWCVNNHIKIYPVPHSVQGEWRLGIQLGHGKEHLSPEAYGPGVIWEKLYEFYEYYKKKYDVKD